MVWLALLACGGGTEPVATPTPEPTPVPTPVPTPPVPTPPPTPISNFGDFFEAFQDLACPLAVGECAPAANVMDCVARVDTPACQGFNLAAAELCLEGEITCGNEERLECASSCAGVCQNISFEEIGRPRIPHSCRDMLLCDQALAASGADYIQNFAGLQDSAYGEGGSCYQGDVAACASACASAVEGLFTAAEAYLSVGDIDAIPLECF